MTDYEMESSEWVDEQILHHETQAEMLRDIKDKLRELRRIKHEMWLQREKEKENKS